MTTFRVGYIVGSLSSKSLNRKLAQALVKLAPAELTMTEIEWRDLPIYSPDYDRDYPPVATAFKAAIAEAHAVLFVTPEYNRSIPGGLKNAIDWASRPYGKNAFARKPSATIGTSPGKIGTAVDERRGYRGELVHRRQQPPEHPVADGLGADIGVAIGQREAFRLVPGDGRIHRPEQQRGIVPAEGGIRRLDGFERRHEADLSMIAIRKECEPCGADGSTADPRDGT